MSKTRFTLPVLLSGLMLSLCLTVSGSALAAGSEGGSRMEQQQASLREALKLTPSQEGAWKTYQEKTRDVHAQAGRGMLSRDELEKLSTPDRMERMYDAAKQRLTVMEKHLQAVKEFYGALNAQQKKTFDQMNAVSMRGGPDGKGGPQRGTGRDMPPTPGKSGGTGG